jgi:cell wall-associated NlpC family hydrolase
MTDFSRSAADHDPGALSARALRRRQRYARSVQGSETLSSTIATFKGQLPGRLPARYVLHILVVLVIPLAILASQIPLAVPSVAPQATMPDTGAADLIAPIAPLSLDIQSDDDAPVADSAFAEIDALPIPSLRPQLLQDQPIDATVVADLANVRGGPGTEYDKIGTLPAGTPLLLLAQYNGWYQARRDDGNTVWVAAELLDLDAAVADFLPDATSIPAPPPPKIGLVAEEGLNLRDGPGTEYIGMTKLPSNTQLDLLARYNDWFQVQTQDGQAGWVLAQYLAIGPGVVDRVETVTTVPELNPALIALVRESNVNLRGGPGVAYDKLGALARNTQLDLLGRYEDWFKVQTPRGTVGWISNELVDANEYILRRVPAVREIPTLARPKPATQQTTSRVEAQRQPAPAPSAAAGSVVEFAMQFVGAPYVWGGSSPKGFDCSGFTRYVYNRFGLSLPHSSAGQYSTAYGTMISNPDELRPGDIVFFVNTYKRGISHVGIYVGDGNVVQAMSPKLGVGVANINGGYWAQHYYGGIRPSR